MRLSRLSRDVRLDVPFLIVISAITGLSAAAQQSPPNPPELEGVISRAVSDVEIRPANGEAIPAVVSRVIKEGTTLSLGRSAQVAIICSTGTYVRIVGPAQWTLNRANCSSGKWIPRDAFEIVSGTETAMRFGRSFELERGALRATRPGPGMIPVVTFPLKRVLSPIRAVRWTSVPNAQKYEVTIVGESGDRISVDAAAVVCTDSLPEYPGLAECSQQLPHALVATPDRPYYVAVKAAASKAAKFPTVAEGQDFRVPRAATVRLVRNRIAQIERLDVDEFTRAQMVARYFVNDSLYAEALPHLRKALKHSESSGLYLQMGEVYESLGLFEFAGSSFERSVKLAQSANDTAAVATGLLGVGRTQFALGADSTAVARLQEAATLFHSIGDLDRNRVAEAAITKIRQRKLSP